MAIEQAKDPKRSHAWGVPLAIGILLVIGGICALVASVSTSYVTVLVIGGILCAVGVVEIVSAFRIHVRALDLALLLAGLLAIVVGGLFISRPLASLASVTLLIAGYLVARGLFHVAVAIVDRTRAWIWDLVYGLVALGMGTYIAASWQQSALWLLGTLVAIEIIARGCTLIAASWAIRDIEHHGELHGGGYAGAV